MTTATKASFSFVDFKINKSFFDFSQARSENLNIGLVPSGKYFTKTNIFKLLLNVSIISESSTIIDIETESVFTFELMPTEQLNIFFVQNAPALIFPYIRAYIGTLTTQSGFPSILLPTLNLTHIAEELSGKIEKIDD